MHFTNGILTDCQASPLDSVCVYWTTLHFLGVFSSLHTMSMISLTLVVAYSMSALSISASKLSIPSAFPFFRCPIAFLTSILLGSDVSISSISSGSSISISLTGLLGFSLFSTSDKYSSRRLVLLSLSSCRFCPLLQHSALAFRCLVVWSGYTVFSCVVV